MSGHPSDVTARALGQDPHRTALAAPPPTTSDPLAALLDNLQQRLAIDPFGNPIQLLALEVTGHLDRRESNAEELAQSIAHLTADGFSDRAARLGTYLGETDPAANEHAIHGILSRLAVKGDFEKFRALIERVGFGVVFTAHPAFTIHHELAVALAELATGSSHDGEPLGQGGRERRMALAVSATHRPEPALTLDIEHAWSLEALRHAHDDLERIHRIAFRIARERWPRQWTHLTPRLISLASWLGYDQAGRTDLTWVGAIGKRLENKQAALERHRASVEALQRNCDLDFRPALEPIAQMLAAAAATVAEQITLLAECDGDPGRTARFARAIVEGRERALVRVGPLVELIDAALAAAPDDASREDLLVMRASLRTHGLGLARIHVRLNSSQLHNAIRREIGLETGPNDPANRRSYFNMVNDLLDRAAGEHQFRDSDAGMGVGQAIGDDGRPDRQIHGLRNAA